MKKFLNKDKSNFLYGMLIAVLCGIVFTACQKNNAKPAAPTPTPPPAVQATPLTALEQSLIGDWICDSTITYNNGVVIRRTVQNDPANCHYLITATERVVGDPDLWKLGVAGLNCSSANMIWRITQGKFDFAGGSHTILNVTSSHLALQWGSVSSGGNSAERYYLHK